MRRREFLKMSGLAFGAVALPRIGSGAAAKTGEPERPNVLWISVEDISPDLGCYGDAYAVTPRLDKFASQGTRFTRCFAHMGVCAPARSGIITGMYPTSIGTNHMRCRGVPQPEVKCFPEYLRAAGYYCTNRSKTDYQFASPVTAWDICGRCDDWRGRNEGQPFFCVINFTGTHESRARSRPGAKLNHDPAKAQLPPYYPDTPVVRRDWAQYHDNITAMDAQVAAVLRQLEADGLADDTIVWFWGDHGRGLPRGKRWIYDSGLHVPLLIRAPEKWRKLASPDNPNALKPGTVNHELISFVDFAPTMLSLCGVPIPKHIQGQAFLGGQKAKPRQYIYGARDRVDEAYDMIRCVRDKRFKYIRNFMPHLPRSLDVAYMNQMPTMQEMRRLAAEGKLKGPQMQYFERPKPIEELYDTKTDPHEVHNLAGEPKHKGTLERLRKELFAWMKQTGDFGLLPECEFDALKRPGDKYETTAAPGITPTKKGDGATVELICATPGASIAYRVSGRKGGPAASGIFLGVNQARMHGKGARRRGGQVTNWRDRNTWFSWEVGIKKPGRIPVHVLQAYARGEPGRKYILSVGDTQLRGQVKKTGGWDRYEFVKVGEVGIPKAGRYTVSIQPVKKPTPYSMNLRCVVLNGKNLQVYKPPAAGWQLYSGPITLWPGQSLTAKACRLGFRDSGTVRFRPGDPGVPAEADEARPHWRQVVEKSGVVGRALALKKLDGQGAKFIDACVRALTGDTRDQAGSVRYWAVLGLHHSVAKDRRRRHIDLLKGCLKDPSPAVRVAAAQALCDWGEERAALPVLVEGLRHPPASGKLLAATALNQIGEKARPAMAAIRAALKSGGYVNRMCQHTLRRLASR